MNLVQKTNGFSFIEVLLAIVILVLASITTVDLVRGSVRATRDAKELTTATMLLQKTMTELETKLESEGIDKGCEKKANGKYEAPFEKFTWVTFCTEIDFKLSESAAKLMEEDKDKNSNNDATKEDLIKKMILQTASAYITKSLRELHVEVAWMQGKTKRKVDATTHFVRYDQPLSLPTL